MLHTLPEVCAIGKFGSQLLLSTWADSGAEGLGLLMREVRKADGGLICVVHLKNGVPPPQGKARDLLGDMFKMAHERVVRFQVIGAGGGFWVAANRAAAATFRLISGGFPIYFESDMDKAMQNLTEVSGKSSRQIEGALSSLWEAMGSEP